MRDEKARPAIFDKRMCHHFAGFGVEVVCGLVERKQPRIGCEGACYLDTLALAMRQGVVAP